MSTQIAWYSQTQFNNYVRRKSMSYDKSSGRVKPYIYYYDKDDNIIQVTEIINGEDRKSNFDDAVCKGPIKKFYKCTNVAIDDAN